MSQQPCTCPSYEGLTYEEIIEAAGLFKRKNKIRNCCEDGGFICPTLDRALRLASVKRDYISRRKDGTTGTPHGERKVLRKKKLKL